MSDHDQLDSLERKTVRYRKEEHKYENKFQSLDLCIFFLFSYYD